MPIIHIGQASIIRALIFSLYVLDSIQSPQDIKQLDLDQLQSLVDEIRAFLIENIQKTGGHLAPNLGTVELTVAMHTVFDTPDDSFVFDVGIKPTPTKY